MACSPLCPLIVLRWSSRLNFWILLKHNYREIGILFQDSNSWNPYHASFKELLHRKRHTLVKVGHQHLVIKAMVRVGYDYLLEYLPLDKTFLVLHALKFEISFFSALILWGGKNFYKKTSYNLLQILMLWGLRLFNQVLDLFFKVMCISFTS